MTSPIFIKSQHHTNEALAEVLAGTTGVAEIRVVEKTPGTRSFSDVLTFVASNSETLIALLGSFFAAWKLYQDGQKLRLDRKKHHLDREKFEWEKEQHRQQQAKQAAPAEAPQPRLLHVQLRDGRELVLPFGFKEEELSQGVRLQLQTMSSSDLKGITLA